MASSEQSAAFPPPPPLKRTETRRRLVLRVDQEPDDVIPFEDELGRPVKNDCDERIDSAALDFESADVEIKRRLLELEEREHLLNVRAKQLKEREAFIKTVEDGLEQKCRELSEREAAIEQAEDTLGANSKFQIRN